MAHPKTYADAHVTFQYPGNWRITTDERHEDGGLVIIDGRSDSLVVLDISAGELTEAEFEDHVESFIAEMPGSIPFGSLQNGAITKAKSPRPGELMTHYHFNIQVATVSVPHTTDFWMQRHGGTSVTGMCQVADEDRAGIEPGFQLIRDTLSAVADK